jgi:hypothetical protein
MGFGASRLFSAINLSNSSAAPRNTASAQSKTTTLRFVFPRAAATMSAAARNDPA